jgi:gas vesicle protein
MSHKKSNLGLGVMIGTVIGGVTAFLLSNKENRELAKRKIADLKKMWEDEKTQERVREIFGTFTEEGKKAYSIARNEITKKLEAMGVDEVDRAKYKAMVEDAVEVVRNETKETTDQLMKLRDSLMSKWTSGKTEKDNDKKN